MRVDDLIGLLKRRDPGAEVKVRLNFEEDLRLDDVYDLDGEYLDVTDERSVLDEGEFVVIIADIVEA